MVADHKWSSFGGRWQIGSLARSLAKTVSPDGAAPKRRLPHGLLGHVPELDGYAMLPRTSQLGRLLLLR